MPLQISWYVHRYQLAGAILSQVKTLSRTNHFQNRVNTSHRAQTTNRNGCCYVCHRLPRCCAIMKNRFRESTRGLATMLKPRLVPGSPHVDRLRRISPCARKNVAGGRCHDNVDHTLKILDFLFPSTLWNCVQSRSFR